MGINFDRTFGAQSNVAAAPATSNDRSAQPKAQFWLNIGYVAENANDDGSDAFIALPLGIPLDTQKPVDTRSSNEGYRERMAARNDLLEQIMAVAETMAGGEEKILNLHIQLRRVAPDQAPVESETNRFARKLEL